MNENKIQLPCMGCGAMLELELVSDNDGIVRHPRPVCEGTAEKIGQTLTLTLEVLEDHPTEALLS
jgi:hypothetical protein